MKGDNLWDYNPKSSDPLRKPATGSQSQSPSTTTPLPGMNLRYSKVYLLDKNIGGSNFILLMLAKFSFWSVNYAAIT